MRRHRPRRDPVTPLVYGEVRLRDGGCVGPRVGFPEQCWGRIELDHVRAGGMGLRSPSTVDNLVSLCSLHHRYKTDHGRTARPLLIDYLDSRGGGRADGK